jgi:hypothetical protein
MYDKILQMKLTAQSYNVLKQQYDPNLLAARRSVVLFNRSDVLSSIAIPLTSGRHSCPLSAFW